MLKFQSCLNGIFTIKKKIPTAQINASSKLMNEFDLLTLQNMLKYWLKFSPFKKKWVEFFTSSTESSEANENLTYHHTFRMKRNILLICLLGILFHWHFSVKKKNSSSAVFLLIRVRRLHTISIGFIDDNEEFLYDSFYMYIGYIFSNPPCNSFQFCFYFSVHSDVIYSLTYPIS